MLAAALVIVSLALFAVATWLNQRSQWGWQFLVLVGIYLAAAVSFGTGFVLALVG